MSGAPGGTALQSVCVFCGSSVGRHPEYAVAARRLGAVLALRGVRVVYGGGRVGLMGALADAALESGGNVVGVIPEALRTSELAHDRLSDLRVVSSMHERKALMAELSDAFVALPGGYGTLDELFEVVTCAQLGIHRKPIALLDAAGYFEPLAAMLDRAVEEGFLSPEHRALIMCANTPEALLGCLQTHHQAAVAERQAAGEAG
ncbi:MAG TPA: TIGR00730 family Rossman fold protein [Chthonomonadales bacterium]|nr:TIGR00730 family Rossman fold protein [Chthonomonadales bacterium]